jgi:hypothetical protein
MSIDDLVDRLYTIQAICLDGPYTLKSGLQVSEISWRGMMKLEICATTVQPSFLLFRLNRVPSIST